MKSMIDLGASLPQDLGEHYLKNRSYQYKMHSPNLMHKQAVDTVVYSGHRNQTLLLNDNPYIVLAVSKFSISFATAERKFEPRAPSTMR